MPELATFSVNGLAIARRSARREPWQVTFAREIATEDLAALAGPAPVADPKAPLARLHEAHHMMAKLLAEGEEPVEVARICGYTPARVRTLINDPAFTELMNHYTQQKVFRDHDTDMAVRHVAQAAGALLMERIEDQPESFSNKELLQIRDSSLDRTGFGPQSKRTVEIKDSRSVLAEIRDMMTSETAARIISRDTPLTAEYVEVPPDVEEDSSPQELADG